MDLKALTLSIHYKGKVLELQAKTSKDGYLNIISGESLQKHCNKGKVGVMAQLKSIIPAANTTPLNPAIELVLKQFTEVFKELTGLPPHS
ncbi:hypothetical protein LguiB_016540 [Lonicera macranthoides]